MMAFITRDNRDLSRRADPRPARRFLSSLGWVLVWVLLWQLAAWKIGVVLLLPSPLAVLRRLMELGGTAAFWATVGQSFLRIGQGFLSGALLGAAFAVAAWRFRWVQAALRPPLSVIQATPVASFIILALVWVQTGWLSTVISAMMVLPLVYHNLLQGLQSVDPLLLEMAQVYGLSRGKRVRFFYLPALMPYLLSALGSGMGLAWKSGIAAEVLGRPAQTIGKAIYESKVYLEMPDLFAWTLTVILLSVLIERVLVALFGRLERRLQRLRLDPHPAGKEDCHASC